MYAQVGDWLVVERANLEHESLKGLITGVRSPDGSPPYLVHWIDDGRTSLVFPGPDAHVMTEAELEEQNERRNQRLHRLRVDLAGRARKL
ncbi:DUF1918 domain-containing protein [Haloechinothrix sp. LS1_15]|uniref:DUF1918 domain-containing protein n=1 Tax=Haloechinothrix sp. LS1_15 TaxID=2652248 RepID=UPI002944FE16|nr:DUF1918 domain-containing protein [Haloechinothrix sp. LS1_15]MDV6014234.1 DUF1918 domain-containing protein [Haloechinothrix sp. LS1_15]